MIGPAITVDTSQGRTVVRLAGRLVTEALESAEAPFARLSSGTGPVVLDLSGLDAIDTGGAYMIAQLQDRLAGEGATVEIAGASEDAVGLIKLVRDATFTETIDTGPPKGLVAWIENLGESVVGTGKTIASLLNFMGLVLSRLARSMVQPWRLRITSLVAQMQQTGFNAVPIIALMGFLIGIVLAYQGAAQLRQFGAEVFVVDLIAVSVLRELGILLTAIIVAGRSGSAFAASIGSMKLNQEVDAMQTLGLDPVEVLVLPRLIALIVMLPILGLIASSAALIGGALMSWVELGVSPGMFVTRFVESTDVWHLIVGMVKAPFFAVIIAIVACWQAFQVGGSAESVGQRTTSAVVQGIFLVIVMDAVFSIFFAELGV